MSRMKEPPSPRTLDSEIPELKLYLKSGMKVLDVGCGTGTITLGVAEAIKPGTVVGIDPGSRQVDVAREWAAQVKHAGNITFQVGDSHHLNFPDQTFDVVYSHTVLHFLLDPVMGLKEQKRVTKKGGWVIASGVRDMIFSIRHPPCPNWDKVYEAVNRYYDARLMKYRASGKDPVVFFEEQYRSVPDPMFYCDLHAGRKCLEWFSKAELVEMQVMIQPRRVQYQHDGMKPLDGYDGLVIDEPKTGEQKRIMSQLEHVIEIGFLDKETLKRAIEEARTWYKDPGAFQFWPEVFVAGRVK